VLDLGAGRAGAAAVGGVGTVVLGKGVVVIDGAKGAAASVVVADAAGVVIGGVAFHVDLGGHPSSLSNNTMLVRSRISAGRC